MNKKDRIAVVISLFYILSVVGITIEKEEAATIPVFLLPILFYWCYRFIKGNISFLSEGFKR